MKTKTKHKEQPLEVKWLDQSWSAEIHCEPFSSRLNTRSKMNINQSRLSSRGFTLIELLVVIAIIAILAGMLLPALSRAKIHAMVITSRAEMKSIEAAIGHYYETYSRYPTPDPSVMGTDFTYGATNAAGVYIGTVNGKTNNSRLMAILLDDDRVGLGNEGHAKNPQKVQCLTVSKRSTSNTSPGLGPDLIYNDPWGNPYLITLDYNYDGKTQDSVYSNTVVSQVITGKPDGFHGLYDYSGTGKPFLLNHGIMIWSFGPDKNADAGVTSDPAVKTVNRDNVLSWSDK